MSTCLLIEPVHLANGIIHWQLLSPTSGSCKHWYY
ncbi:hypothetical protein SLEP1_g9677 [Rubroshorea leprosula]|uniref:Uncharacterized protein n=1 Tax=Rubroshorea leprosula TaxID=152421 RepID=A0AAV5I5N8_9ROSI|nr:hypothetical protein SLEP1_g9677 [Rubroshorea leprosula]